MQRKYFASVIFRKEIFSTVNLISTNRDFPVLGYTYPMTLHTSSEHYMDYIS